jgi:hypothetical protein
MASPFATPSAKTSPCGKIKCSPPIASPAMSSAVAAKAQPWSATPPATTPMKPSVTAMPSKGRCGARFKAGPPRR